ncbi:MAG: zf-HC2 domain-containing protein [Acidobacteria bacterium]|nr:zf-HC2 domain-containing protein [Acidobacteriota bacterium]
MKPDPNMEMDRLLRRHARQGPGSSLSFAAGGDRQSDGGGAAGEPEGLTHLDADELNAYAENALPARTRARYTEHLAGCDSCRKLVTGLVLSSGIAAQLEKEAAPQALAATAGTAPARSWGDWFAALFAPTRLRYAASILAVVGIAAIALMVFRSGKQPLKFDAGNSQQSPRTKEVTPNGNTGAAPAPLTPDASNTEGNALPTPTLSQSPAPFKSGEGAPVNMNEEPSAAPKELDKNTEQQQGPGNSPAPPPAVNDSDAGGKGSLRDQEESLKQPVLSSPADDGTKAKKEISGADTSTELAGAASGRAENARPKSAKTTGTPENKTEFGKSVSADAVASRRARGAQEAERKDASPSAGAAMDERAGSREDRPASKPDEKRSVSGRQFVRRGGAWTDTAYRGQATTNVRRGSDQYRALVADEPGLRAIADQFSGEVIIVWNGRAYRIH